jgi:hypothetical protein
LDLGPYWTRFCFHINDEITHKAYAELADPDANPEKAPLPHMDYDGLTPYPSMLFDPRTRAYTAIFCLEMPSSGAGLVVYPIRAYASRYRAPTVHHPFNNDLDFIEMARGNVVEPVSLKYSPGSLAIIDSFCPHYVPPGQFSEANPRRMVCVVHYLYLDHPKPHWQYWC